MVWSLGMVVEAVILRALWILSPLVSILVILSTPALFVLHYMLVVVDKLNRLKLDRYRRNWPHKTVPHVRPITAKPDVDMKKWRLHCHEGRQVWQYDDENTSGRKDQTFIERYMLGLTMKEKRMVRKQSADALFDGAKFLSRLQHEDGHWPNDYSGPLFLTPGVVFIKYAIYGGNYKHMFSNEAQRLEIIRYLANHQNPDGGWGMHTESHSTMLGTVLNYDTVRLAGEPATSPMCLAAKEWIRSRGGAISIPSWGKMWLCIMNLYSYNGVAAVLPEMWLLPYWVPFAMGRFWCHSRMVTLPFGYFFGKKWQCPLDATLIAIRGEIYIEHFHKIAWSKQRGNIYKDDVYTPISFVYRLAAPLLGLYDKIHLRTVRKQSLKVSIDHMKYDDMSTNYICLGPVNKVLNMLVAFVEEGVDSPHFRRHEQRLDDYLWEGPEGLRMIGYNGSQLWDTSFAAQALCAGGLEGECPQALRGAHHYIDVAQVREDPPAREGFFRSRTKGSWNFSTRDQGWQVSDCTAEGLRIPLLLRNSGILATPFPQERIFEGVDEVLSLRSEELGGWGSYEAPRGPKYLELLNCADIYKDIMIDYVYSECSSSCVHTLCLFRRQFPSYRSNEVNTAIREGVRCVKRMQRSDGSFYGSWGNCFTYAGFLVSEALKEAGETQNSPVFRKLTEFTLSKQMEDGGWGEDFNSCVTCEYVHSEDGSQIVNTAWAVMTLIACNYTAPSPVVVDAIESGVRIIMSRQLMSGDWAQERTSGVFNGNCSIHYPGYKNSMPVWALGKYVTWSKERKEEPI